MVRKRNNYNIISFFANLIIKYKIVYLVVKTLDKILTFISLCKSTIITINCSTILKWNLIIIILA